MGYEIDFLAVERGEKSGDAIAFRIGNLNGRPERQFVGIVDGGYTEDGEQLVKHVRQHYGTNVVDLVVSSHSDDDHSQGLVPVLGQMDVRLLWMHQPWNHADKIRRMFTNDRLTTRGLSDKFTRSLASAKSVERVAMRRGIPIIEPFAGEGVAIGNRVYVVGPNRHGIVVDAMATTADGTAEREAAMLLLRDQLCRRRSALGADKNYDTRDFTTASRDLGFVPHVTENLRAPPRDSWEAAATRPTLAAGHPCRNTRHTSTDHKSALVPRAAGPRQRRERRGNTRFACRRGHTSELLI